MAADTPNNAAYRLVKVTDTIAADTNIPGLLMAYPGLGSGPEGADELSWLDLEDGVAQVFITLNGVPKLTGPDNTFAFYPGTTIAEGDVKCNAELSAGDLITIRYGQVSYREIPAA